jgi:hypothetical protein
VSARRLLALSTVFLIPAAGASAVGNPVIRTGPLVNTHRAGTSLMCVGSGAALTKSMRASQGLSGSFDLLLGSPNGWLSFCVTLGRP